MYGSFAFMSVCISRVYLVTMKVRRVFWIPWDWSYIQLWASMWVLRISYRSWRLAPSSLKHWGSSPAPFLFLNVILFISFSPFSVCVSCVMHMYKCEHTLAVVHVEFKACHLKVGIFQPCGFLGLNLGFRQAEQALFMCWAISLAQ